MDDRGETTLLASLPKALLIGGTWVDGDAGTITVCDPATGEALASIADAGPAQAGAALDAAVDARPGWAATPPRDRAEVLRRAWELLMSQQDMFALLITLEMGKPLAESRTEVAYAGEFLRWFGEEASRIAGRYQSTPEGTGQMVIGHRPVGPCYLITPWNFPLAMATRKIAPAIAAGCTTVVKPAELTPLTTLAFARLLGAAGLPAGVVNVVTTSDPGAVSDRLLGDPRLRKLSFTGSTAVGVDLLRRAADPVLNTSMELGGNAPFVVFDDADLDRALDGAVLAKFRNGGQACTAANRFLVQDGIADEFVSRLSHRVAALRVGRGTDDGVDVGPLITGRAVQNSLRLIREAVDGGAVVCTGGHAIDSPGHFLEPTVLDHVDPAMAVSTEEIFAPVAAVQRFGSEAEAVTLANGTDAGLVGYVFTRDESRGRRMTALLETGMVGLNVGAVSNAAAPFGGLKRSGLGREGGAEGIHEYLETTYCLLPNPVPAH